jgi:hypothetical protein
LEASHRHDYKKEKDDCECVQLFKRNYTFIYTITNKRHEKERFSRVRRKVNDQNKRHKQSTFILFRIATH